MSVVVPPGPEERDAGYWYVKADEAEQRELAETQRKFDEAKRTRDAERVKTEQALRTWSSAVEARDKRRRNIGLMLAGVGAVVGVLLLFWASRTHGFWENLWVALGEAMLVAATVEVAARIVRKMINAPQSRVEEDWRAYLKRINDNVGAISTDLALESVEREAAKLSAGDRNTAEQKALWEDRREAYGSLPSRSPTDERFLQIYTELLTALPAIPDSHYYRARAELETERETERINRLLQGGKSDETSD